MGLPIWKEENEMNPLRPTVLLLTLCLMLPSIVARAGDVAEATRILDRYLAAPIPKGPSKTDAYDPKADQEVIDRLLRAGHKDEKQL